ncbi:glycosyltransferase family 2 protein [Polaribacter marinaquae]|uniref:Glycosyltransferase family 2 protein n=1 Tax=Polaribacter marinaquae TaxID=1642819 RepID=A0ABZ2TW29_9FLAO
MKQIKTEPVITIITSTFNAVSALSITIDSIRNQNYTNIQWIIIDGKSTDGTVELINKNEDIIDFWLSERDEGIYDAWNKGVKHIKGEWVIFLGAGDVLYSNNVLSNMASHLSDAFPKYNLVYGKVDVVNDDNESVADWGEPWELLKNKTESIRIALPPHPGSFLHVSFFCEKKYLFPTSLKIAGDTHSLMTAVIDKEPLFVPIYIDKMLFGGVSTTGKNLLLIIKELKFINQEFNVNLPFFIYYWNLSKIYIKAFVNIVFPEKIIGSLYNSFLKVKYRFK